MLTLEDQPFTTGRCRYTDADGRSDGAAKICIKVVPGDWQSPVLAILDTGADWSVLNTEIAEDLGLFGIDGESITLSTRFGTIAGHLVPARVTLIRRRRRFAENRCHGIHLLRLAAEGWYVPGLLRATGTDPFRC